MARQPSERLRLQVIYRGKGPLIWSGGPGDFGVQDKAERLHPGAMGSDGGVRFDLWVEVKPGGEGAPVFLGPFAHGPAGARFLYLSWRNPSGGYAQRLKLPLGAITRGEVRAVLAEHQRLIGEVIDLEPRVTSTGANIGGARPIAWKLAAP